MKKLPEEFKKRMQKLLGNEYQEFINSFSEPRHYGLRVNTLKINADTFKDMYPYALEPVPWTANGFYFSEGERPAKHPYYHAGLYYIQEPSAMAPGAVLGAKPGEKVLDLCAAPGGKSTQAAADLAGSGILVANDVSKDRVKALVKNIENFGVKNAVITNETPSRLAEVFTGFFDKVIIDAPCSGEGMFRKDPEAAKKWAFYNIETCASIQKDILCDAAKMLKPGGYLIYSTCTFAPEENEGKIEEFLKHHPSFKLVDIPKKNGLSPGRPDWVNGREELKKCARLWPHKVKGEGHFIALLQKTSGYEGVNASSRQKALPASSKGLEYFSHFINENMNTRIEGNLILYGNHLYLMPEGLPNLEGLKVVRPGWYLGMLKKKRFEPSHAMAMALRPADVKRVVNFSSSSREVLSYLKGETLFQTGEKGWTLVCVDGFPLGWAKQVSGLLKNYYPKGWRWLD